MEKTLKKKKSSEASLEQQADQNPERECPTIRSCPECTSNTPPSPNPPKMKQKVKWKTVRLSWNKKKNYANKSGLKFLHIDVRESFSVIANASFQFLLLKVAQVVVFSLGGNYFHRGSCGFGYLFSPFNKWNNLKYVLYLLRLCLSNIKI